MVIYAIQAALFVSAYFLRYESDLVILGVVSAFFAASILAFQAATRCHWRLRAVCEDAGAASSSSRLLGFLGRPKFVQRWSYAALAAALALYAALIIAQISALNRDMQILILALLAAAAGYFLAMRGAPLGLVEKGTLFVTATLLVYLESQVVRGIRF